MTSSDPGVYIVGAGGVGREALEVAIAAAVHVAGFVDEAKAGLVVRQLAVRSPDDLDGGRYIVAIGDAAARIRLAHELGSRGMRAISLRHPSAVVATDARVGQNCLIGPQVTISVGVRVHDHCQIHYNASVGHDTHLEEGATVLPGANVAGGVRVGRATMIGSGAVVLQGLQLGSAAKIGAGAVVTRDVPDGAVVVGSPARPTYRGDRR